MNRATVRSAILVFALVALAVLAYRQVRRSMGSGEQVPITAGALTSGAEVVAGDLAARSMSENAVPPDAIRSPSQIEGRTLQRAKSAGQFFTESDFRRSASLGERVPEGRVLVTVAFPQPASWTFNIGSRDRFDIISVQQTQSGAFTRVLSRNTILVGQTQQAGAGQKSSGALGLATSSAAPAEQQPMQLHLAVRPQEVVALTQASGRLKLIVHGSKEVQREDLLSIDRFTGRVVDVLKGRTRTPEVLR